MLICLNNHCSQTFFSPFNALVLKSPPCRITERSATQLYLFITNRSDIIKSNKTRAILTISDHDIVLPLKNFDLFANDLAGFF